jgi:hypothetical protein
MASRICGVSSVALEPSSLRMSPPEAQISGVKVKMLQPPQAPEK